MGRISKAQNYAIRWLSQSEGKDSSHIATELNLTVKQVNSVLEKSQSSQKESKIATAQQPAIQKIMSGKTQNNTSVTMMSEQASMQIQERKSKSSRPTSDCIHRPNG